MLKRHEVEIVLQAGHPKTEVARLSGVSLWSVVVNGRPRDMIVRRNSEIPLEITFLEFKPADASGCSEWFNPSFHTRTRTDSPFVSKRWYPKSVLWGRSKVRSPINPAS